MGYTCAIFGSVLDERDDQIEDKAFQVRFRDTVYVSDHFNRSIWKPDPRMEKIALFDRTLLAFVNPKDIDVNEYQQTGTISGSVEEFDYVNEVFFGPDDEFCVYFLSLPRDYYPKQFIVPDEPHFAARIGERIRITWWFREQIKIKLRIRRDQDKFSEFDHIDSPSFLERHPQAIAAYRGVENLVAKTLGEAITL